MATAAEKACFEVVLKSGSVKQEDLQKVFRQSEETRSPFSRLLVESGLLSELDLLRIYAASSGTSCVSLKSARVERSALDRVPVKFASYYKFFPLKLEHRRLTIAVARLLDLHTRDEIRLGLGYEVDVVFAREAEIEDMLKHHYGLGADTVNRILMQQSPSAPVGVAPEAGEEVENIEKLAETASVVQLVNQIILDAYKRRASDIHMEPFRGRVRLRYRIDGVMQEAPVPAEMRKFFRAILSRIKIMANLNIVERRLPQDGKARVKTQDQSLDLRVSSIPTPFGESMVIRLLQSKMIFGLDKLGLEGEHLAGVQDLIRRPHGILFVTGPTGSGKSTTLYAALAELNAIERKVITIEDPIEYEMEGITQIQVMPEVGLTFARGLRSMLRHDPDVMMVGEVRDFETADIAIRVALTGHLILSTLHTNDSASGVTRLLDIGVPPYLIASSVVAFMAQRLVRVICPHCKEEDIHAPEEVRRMIASDLALAPGERARLFRGRGCDACNGTGFSGRVALYEILPLDDEIRKLIFAKAPAERIKLAARAQGMATLRQDGWRKALRGLSTTDEVLETTPADEAPGPGGAPAAAPERKSAASGLDAAPKAKAREEADEAEVLKYRGIYDRRKFGRVKVKFRMLYRSLEGEGESKQRAQAGWDHEGVIENLSAGGVGILTASALDVGALLELHIELPGTERAVECVGRVLRVTRLIETLSPQDQFVNRVAVLFLSIESAERSRLETFCRQDR